MYVSDHGERHIAAFSNSFKSIYRSFLILNSKQLFRTSGPNQYSALNKKIFEKLKNRGGL